MNPINKKTMDNLIAMNVKCQKNLIHIESNCIESNYIDRNRINQNCCNSIITCDRFDRFENLPRDEQEEFILSLGEDGINDLSDAINYESEYPCDEEPCDYDFNYKD